MVLDVHYRYESLFSRRHGGDDRHAGTEHRAVGKGAIQHDFDRNALHHFDKIPRGIFGRQQAKDGACTWTNTLDRTVKDLAGIGVDLQRRLLSGAHVAKLRFLEIRLHSDMLQRYQCHQGPSGLHHLADLDIVFGDHSPYRGT